MKTSSSILLIASAVAMTLGACKQNEAAESETDSLDNFAGGTAVHECRGPFGVSSSAKIDGSSSLQAVVEQTLSAVPTGVQDIFFETLRGSIKISGDTSLACTGVPNSAKRRSKAISCWKIENGAPVIYLSASKRAIKHSMVRAFGYFVSEDWFKGSDMYPAKVDIAKSFLADVANSKKYKLAYFGAQLDGAVLEESISDGERSKRLDQLPPPVHSVARDVFYDYVFAETFDSHFCNAKTRGTLAKGADFERTGRAWAEIVGLFGELNAKVVGSSNDAGSGLALTGGNEGLALFGRYHRGGPIRNIIARRNDGLGVFQGNGPIRRATGIGPAPRVAGSSQFGNVDQLNYTTPQATAEAAAGTAKAAPKTFENQEGYNGGKYVEQADGKFGWVPANSPADFKPTYLAVRDADGKWTYDGSKPAENKTPDPTLKPATEVPPLSASEVSTPKLERAPGTEQVPAISSPSVTLPRQPSPAPTIAVEPIPIPTIPVTPTPTPTLEAQPIEIKKQQTAYTSSSVSPLSIGAEYDPAQSTQLASMGGQQPEPTGNFGSEPVFEVDASTEFTLK